MLIRRIGPRQAVFHRAFDVVPDPLLALDQLIDLGIHRIMTSGQEATALQGIPLIAALVQHAQTRIEILPAGGIRADHVRELLAQTGCDQVHASLRSLRSDVSTTGRPQVRFGSPTSGGETQYDATDRIKVAEMAARLAEFHTQQD
jgi:copper homeostasis protein